MRFDRINFLSSTSSKIIQKQHCYDYVKMKMFELRHSTCSVLINDVDIRMSSLVRVPVDHIYELIKSLRMKKARKNYEFILFVELIEQINQLTCSSAMTIVNEP